MSNEKEMAQQIIELTDLFKTEVFNFFHPRKTPLSSVALILSNLSMELINHDAIYSSIDPEIYRKELLNFVSNYQFMNASETEKLKKAFNALVKLKDVKNDFTTPKVK